MRKLTLTKVPGLKKRMTGSSPTSKLTARAAGAPFPKLLDFSVAAKAAVSAGLIICALILSAATSLMRRMSSLSSYTASLVTSMFL